MARKHQFFCVHKSSQFSFADGHTINFVDGKCYTDNPQEIAELNAATQHSSLIFVNPKEVEVNMDEITPEAQLRKKLEAEIRAKIAAEQVAEVALQDQLQNEAKQNAAPNSLTARLAEISQRSTVVPE